jgi:hypothetical protein
MTLSFSITSRNFLSNSGLGGYAEWIPIGIIQGAGRVHTTELDISNFRSKDIAVKVRARGVQSVAPELSKIEIEYMPIGVVQRSISATILAMEDIELLNMEHENNVAIITATLYSCAESQQMFVVHFPHPEPVGHTMRCQVKIVAPGNNVPDLSYSHPISSEIKVQFDEL